MLYCLNTRAVWTRYTLEKRWFGTPIGDRIYSRTTITYHFPFDAKGSGTPL